MKSVDSSLKRYSHSPVAHIEGYICDMERSILWVKTLSNALRSNQAGNAHLVVYRGSVFADVGIDKSATFFYRVVVLLI